MSAVIAAQQARKGVERRNEHEAEKKAQQKCVADAEKALKKLEKASTLEELEDAVRRGSRLKSYLPELEKALPAAKKKLEKLAGLSQGLSGAARVCWPEPHAPRSLVVPAQDERRRGVEPSDRLHGARRGGGQEGRRQPRLAEVARGLLQRPRARPAARPSTATPHRACEARARAVERRPALAQFSENDDDGNGALNYEEFKQAMDIIAPSFGPAELKGAFSAADKDGSGTVDYKEFMKRAAQFQAMSEEMASAEEDSAAKPSKKGSSSKASSGEEKNLLALSEEEKREAKKLFAKYDKDESGDLGFDEFRKVMKVIAGEGLSDSNLLKAFEAVDKNGSGQIDYNEFLAGQQELKKWKQKRKPQKKK